MTPPTDEPVKAVRAIELWFFRDLREGQRSNLIRLAFGAAVAAEADNQRHQKLLLRKLLAIAAMPAAPEPDAGVLREALAECADALIVQVDKRFRGNTFPDARDAYDRAAAPAVRAHALLAALEHRSASNASGAAGVKDRLTTDGGTEAPASAAEAMREACAKVAETVAFEFGPASYGEAMGRTDARKQIATAIRNLPLPASDGLVCVPREAGEAR